MEIIINPAKSLWPSLSERITRDNSEIEARVHTIIDRVKTGGDQQLRAISREIDGFCQSDMKVTEAEFEEAARIISPDVRRAIDNAFDNIYTFHKAQVPQRITVTTAPGVTCIQKPVPIGKVGLYIPGGTAPLFSTVLMLGVPSLVAGCPHRIMCSPSGNTGKLCPELLYAAQRCGISDIWKIGGAQAIAAMAYGTETIPKVDKIFGPGNRYVTTAKQLVSGVNTSIDMPAGPSEVMVLSDKTANPAFVAADLLSQAEHGRDSQAILACTDENMARRVYEEVEKQAALLKRREMVEGSLSGSRLIVFEDVETLLEFAEYYAPEHLIISMENADEVAERITAAGSVFIGNYTPESAGDYASGTNHTLPTSGWARSCSGVNIDSFIRKMTLQKITPQGLASLSGTIVDMAEAEGLQAHAEAVRIRMKVSDAAVEDDRQAWLDSLVRDNIKALQPYSCARDEFEGTSSIMLDANENPFNNGINRYPDPRQRALKKKVSEIKGVPADHIFMGNGSDEAIDLIYRIFCTPGRDNVVAISPTYGMYQVSAAINGVEYRDVPLEADFSLDTEKLLGAADGLTKAIFICSPNNPTGNAFPVGQILDVARRFRGIVVVDEAYIDFSDKGTVAGCGLDNVIVLQTMSKARGMAGLRVGLAFAVPEIIAIFNKVKYPYNLSCAAIGKCAEMLEKDCASEVSMLLSERSRVASELEGISIVRKVFDSDANFLLVKFDDPCTVYDYLVSNGIIVRNRNSVPGCSGCLRLTIGTSAENDRMVELLRNL